MFSARGPIRRTPRPEERITENPRVVRPDPLDEVTACVTEFNRPEALKRLRASIDARFPGLKVEVQPTGGNLSWARNELARRCRTPFYFMLEEDFVLDARTDLGALLDVLAAEPGAGGVSAFTEEPKTEGGAGRGGRIWWDRDLVRIGGKVFFNPGRRPMGRTASGVPYRLCDLILNFGLFRTETLRAVPWDEKIPIGSEHADWYWRAYLDGRWCFAHVPRVMAAHLRDRPGPAYNVPRRRSFAVYSRQKNGVEFVRHPAQHGALAVPNVVLLGTGCSNTTVTARMAFRAFGFHAGDLDEAYQEERRVRRVNEHVWRAGRPFPVDMRRALRRIPQPWLIKDPRFRRTLPHWLDAFAEFRPLLLYVTKDAAAVRASYARHGWLKSYDPADVARCEESFEGWPWAKVKVAAEDLGAAAALFDPSRMRPAGGAT